MTKTPIVFSFNEGYVMPAGVCITSLLINAHKDTFYDIFILYSSERLFKSGIDKITVLKEIYSNCDFTFIDVKEAFKNAYETRKITVDAYYRLLIPEIITHYDRVIYSDVDVVFDKDLSNLLNVEFKDNLILARHDSVPDPKYLESVNLDHKKYINSGFMLFNLKKIRLINNTNSLIKSLVKKNFRYQDQDIINICFINKIGFLENKFNYTFLDNRNKIDIDNVSVFHYTGAKPWNKIVPFGDVWWQYYRKSIFYDENFYSQFTKREFHNFNEYLTLGKVVEKLKMSRLVMFIINLILRLKRNNEN